jgi:hypothetical protein
VFIIEVLTKTGKVCERFETYEKAWRRVQRFRPDTLLSAPFIFQELPDGSTRLIREDLKPLQWHRILEEETPECEQPIPLSEVPVDSSEQPLIKVLPQELREWTWEE